MRALYWRPQRVSLRALLAVTFLALCAFAAIETFQVEERQPHHELKVRAARTALAAFRVLKQARLQRGIPIDPEVDPAESGLIGELITPTTTNTGHLPSKQTSVNPNFAAVVVEMLLKAGVREGDTIAVGMSGSFPALNVCVLGAAHALRLRPLTISSVGASQWGANSPRFTWLDMEQVLAASGTLPYRSIAATPGGIEDRASGLSGEGDRLLREALDRSGLPLIDPRDYDESLERRMALYREHAGDFEISAYVNVGGSTVSVGTRRGKVAFRPGINRSLPRDTHDSVMVRFAGRGIPIIHLTKIDQLAERYGLPLQPARIPAIGEGATYVRTTYNRWLALGVLGGLVALLAAVLRFDLGHRWLGAGRGDRATGHDAPEPMV